MFLVTDLVSKMVGQEVDLVLLLVQRLEIDFIAFACSSVHCRYWIKAVLQLITQCFVSVTAESYRTLFQVDKDWWCLTFDWSLEKKETATTWRYHLNISLGLPFNMDGSPSRYTSKNTHTQTKIKAYIRHLHCITKCNDRKKERRKDVQLMSHGNPPCVRETFLIFQLEHWRMNME